TGVALARAIVAAGINIDAPERLTDQLRRANIEFDPAHLPEARRYIEAGMPPVGADMAIPFSDPSATPASKQPPDKNRRGVTPPQVQPSDVLEMSGAAPTPLETAPIRRSPGKYPGRLRRGTGSRRCPARGGPAGSGAARRGGAGPRAGARALERTGGGV